MTARQRIEDLGYLQLFLQEAFLIHVDKTTEVMKHHTGELEGIHDTLSNLTTRVEAIEGELAKLPQAHNISTPAEGPSGGARHQQATWVGTPGFRPTAPSLDQEDIWHTSGKDPWVPTGRPKRNLMNDFAQSHARREPAGVREPEANAAPQDKSDAGMAGKVPRDQGQNQTNTAEIASQVAIIAQTLKQRGIAAP